MREWVRFLRQEKSFGDDDPLFPKTINGHNDDKNFMPLTLSCAPWANATPVRKIFKEAFARVGLPYAAPHSVRHTLTQFAYGLGLNAEQMKAFSQNLGQEIQTYFPAHNLYKLRQAHARAPSRANSSAGCGEGGGGRGEYGGCVAHQANHEHCAGRDAKCKLSRFASLRAQHFAG